MIHALHRGQIDRYFAGSLRPTAVTRVLRRLSRCGACRARYERHLLLEGALPDGDLRGQDRLWRSIVATASSSDARSAPAARPAPAVQRPVLRPSVLAAAGALAGVLLVVVGGARMKTATAPVARGAAAEEPATPSVHFFRSVGPHQTEPVAQTIHADDGILIAYSNPGADLSYLMVFAVDVRGGVHWYYPAYEAAGQNPAAPAIRTRALGVELGEEIRHALPIGPLRIFALFLPRPLRAEEVEEMLSEAWGRHGKSVVALERLPIAGGEQMSRLLDVTP